ncbi:hypothetical protein [Nocardia amikacinitolerans]|uniref:hypothetical protein n=1 Tax=Nocardia amikacinitolerans TaxID=756689 RepID=UPI0020A32334|nr:hypothetical protein [Nocardia amikacinitolerans]MCP2276460.1 hypothetical protein [Nocardia amikacinitolerans]
MTTSRESSPPARVKDFAPHRSQTFCDWNHSQTETEFHASGDRSVTAPAALEGVIAKLPGLAGYGAWTSSPADLAPTCPTPAVAVVLINDPREESVHTATLVALPELDGTATSGRAVGVADFSYLPTSDERSQV